MKKILIFGGSGFIGSALAKSLSQEHQVTVFDNNERKHSIIELPESVKWIKGDICDINSVRKVVKNQNIIYNLAYIVDYNFHKV